MIETHPFGYYVPSEAKKLIIGSFPCYSTTYQSYGQWFYEGSGKNLFWRLLGDVFSHSFTTLADKKLLCQQQRIALTDILLQITRRQWKCNRCADSNLIIQQINHEGIHHCLKAPITHIFFTSKLVAQLFQQHFSAISLPTFTLPSPSPAANRAIGSLKDYQQQKEAGLVSNTYEYRLSIYKKMLFA